MTSRSEDRFEIVLSGRCRDVRLRRSSAEISELSANGCKVRTSLALLAKGEPLWVKLGNRDFLEAEIRWHRGDTAGLRWRFELHPSILDHIYAEHAKNIEQRPRTMGSAASARPIRRAV